MIAAIGIFILIATLGILLAITTPPRGRRHDDH